MKEFIKLDIEEIIKNAGKRSKEKHRICSNCDNKNIF